MQRTTLTLLMASLLLATSACQPKTDLSDSSSESDIGGTTSSSTQQPLKKAVTPKALTKAFLASSEKQLTNDLICIKLSKAMSAIDDKSKFEDIHAIQRQLEACLPITDNPAILQWLAGYQAMYRRFLEIDPNTNEESFYALMNTVEQGKKPSLALLKAISPRLRYLTGLVQNKNDLSVLYLGEGEYTFHHDLKAMADLFTPYLSKDQSKFIQRMAKDNQGIFWNDAGIAIPFDEVIERASFWESYVQQYPNSYFIQDAKNLFAIYRYILFFGSENTQWTDDSFREFYNPEDKQAVQQLAKRSNRILAQDAQNFLDFMVLSDGKRQKKYPAPSRDADGNEMNNWAKARYQLKEALQIPSPWTADSRNCFDGVVCMDNSVE